MASRTAHGHLDAIFAACDGGTFTLPRELLNLRGHLTRVEQQAGDLAEPAEDEYAAFDRLSAQLATGGDLDLDAVFAARAATERYDLTRRAYMQAAEKAGDALVSAVWDLQDEIVHEHFAPAQKSIIDAARTAHATYREHGSTPAELMSAPKAARDAYTRIDGLYREFSTLRRSVFHLRQLTGGTPQHDVRELFGVIRNVEKVWPEVLSHLNTAPTGYQPPWPADDSGFLLYLSQPGIEAWCPTVAEQDARWWEVFGARVEQGRRDRQAMEAFSSLGPAGKTGGLVGVPGPGGTAA